jgi:hypothetical protein
MQVVKEEIVAASTSLNTRLDEIDNKLGRLSFGLGPAALDILKDLDEVKLRLDQYGEQSVQVKGETSQFEAACAMLLKEGRIFMRQVGGSSALKAMRLQVSPPDENWWWRLDEILAEENKKKITRAARTMIIAAVVLGVLYAVYRIFFPPDPNVIAVLDAQQSVEQYASQGNLDQAMVEVDKGLAKVPGSPELLMYKAVIFEIQGKTAEAEVVYNDVQKKMADVEYFNLSRGQLYLILNQPALGQLARKICAGKTEIGQGLSVIGKWI